MAMHVDLVQDPPLPKLLKVVCIAALGIGVSEKAYTYMKQTSAHFHARPGIWTHNFSI